MKSQLPANSAGVHSVASAEGRSQSPAKARLHEMAALCAAIRNQTRLVRYQGHVAEVSASRVLALGLARHAQIRNHVEIETSSGPIRGEVSRVCEDHIVIAPFTTVDNVRIADPVNLLGSFSISPHDSWKGRVVDPLCRPIDGTGPLAEGGETVAVEASAPPALARQSLGRPLKSDVKAIDAFTPICEGQRLGVFAGSGVGKSTLLGMLSRMPDIDTIVTVLVGERGREVGEFVEETLGAARRRTVCVVATSNETPMMRQQAPPTGLAIAEYFRDQGDRVLLIIDSMTRYAHALRDYALGASEMPVARGFPPSVFSSMAQLMERAGPGRHGTGSITAVVSILVDGDDHNDPVSDSLRGILDGHVILDRKIASQGRFPAIDVINSISRAAERIYSNDQRATADRLRRLLARFEDTRDIRMLGGYQPGTDILLDEAIAIAPRLYEFLQQKPTDPILPDLFERLAEFTGARGKMA